MKGFLTNHYLIVFCATLALSLVFTPLMRRAAVKCGQVSRPKDNRWHQRETALMGGVGIFMSAMPLWLIAAFVLDWPVYGHPYLPLAVCAAGIFVLGLVDDIFNMDPQNKLAGQIVIASVLIFFGFRVGWTDSETINLVLSFFWIVGITNAFNLLDNMDGLAAGVALISGAFLFLFLFMEPETRTASAPVLLMLAAYCGAVSGFLVYNFNPASIFMGDAGSLFLGFMLACLTVAADPGQAGQGGSSFHLLSVMAIPILILFIPILDTGFVSLMRKLFRRAVSHGGKDHSSHRMVAIGFSERKAVLVLYGFSVASGLIALAMRYLSAGISLVVIALYLLFVLFFWIYLARVKVYQEESILSGRGAGLITPILVEITYRRRLLEVLLDSVLITVAYYTAYLLRFEGQLGGNFDFFLKSLPILISCQIFAMYILGVYRGVWESTGLRDLVGYVQAISVGTVMTILILLFVYRFMSFSRAVFVIYWFFMLILVSLSRLSFRMLDEGIRKNFNEGIPTLIYGAGAGGQMALKEIETNREMGLSPVGFVDDNVRIHRRRVKGYPVLGGQDQLPEILRKYKVRKIVVAFREKGAEKKRELRAVCAGLGLEVDVAQMRLVID
ncbi:MAG: glycosyl transferase [Deltaproteobacteria bacterium]|nr:glycosyl transferase [Deltaproteobacteria bacterium]